MTRLTKQASVRIGGILAGVGVLFVGGVLITSSPAMADNGPHISNAGNPAIGSGPDGCAGCHRIHSAKSDNGMLLVNASEEKLCATCHEGGTGATTDVINGVQYSAVTGGQKTTQALRGGGFDFSLIGSGAATRAFTSSGSIDNTLSNVPVAAAAVGTTSQHALGANSGTMWGTGKIGSGAGTTVSLECGSCHDPHGNGNFRILKPIGGLGASNISMNKAISAASQVADTVNSGKYVWTFAFAADPGFTPGQAVAVAGTDFGGYDFTPSLPCTSTRCSWSQAVISSVTYGNAAAVPPVPWTISIPNMAQSLASTAGGTVSSAMPNTIKSVTGEGTGTLTFTTYVNHGLSTGQVISLAGFTPSTYNLSKVAITATGVNTFTVAVNVAAADTATGYISGIPDALPAATPDAGYVSVGANKKVYNTLNYWRADDHNYTGATTKTGVQFPSPATSTTTNTTNGESAFIINASQWCTTCHTRYLAAGSTSRKFTSGDSTFTFRHTSGAYKENSPDCMQCHVAHGSNAQMTGDFTANLPDPSSAASYPMPPVGGTNDSRLLRVDNRGTCLFCHNY